MAKVFFENPMNLSGSSEDKLRQLYGYLYGMSEKLNEALNTISVEQMEPQVQTVVRKAEDVTQKQQTDVNALKSMIIKTASVVRSEMDEIGTRLQGSYEALSDTFGEYRRETDTVIAANANGIKQIYNVTEQINSDVAGLEEYKTSTSGWIFTGIIDATNNIIGVAIGQEITGDDGKINPTKSGQWATFTADRLSFWFGDTEVAYFAGNEFNIATGKIVNSLQMGDNFRWQINSDNSLALMALQARP